MGKQMIERYINIDSALEDMKVYGQCGFKIIQMIVINNTIVVLYEHKLDAPNSDPTLPISIFAAKSGKIYGEIKDEYIWNSLDRYAIRTIANNSYVYTQHIEPEDKLFVSEYARVHDITVIYIDVVEE